MENVIGNSEIIETEYFVLQISDQIIQCQIREGAVVDRDFLVLARNIVKRRRPREKFYVLAESEGFFHITPQARELSASEEYNSHLLAIAFCTSNYSLRLLAHLYNHINKPVVDTRCFNSRETAMEWLQELRKQQCLEDAPVGG